MREYLDKQKLLMALNEKYHDMSAMPASYYAGFQYAIKLIEKLNVSEEVAPVVHGRWKLCYEDDRHQIEGDECTACGFQHYGTTINHYCYCPACGAKMDLEAEKSWLSITFAADFLEFTQGHLNPKIKMNGKTKPSVPMRR